MYAGRVVEIGPTTTIFSAPSHPLPVRLLRAVPSVERAEVTEGIEGQPPRPANRPQGAPLRPDAPGDCGLRKAPPPPVRVGSELHLARCIGPMNQQGKRMSACVPLWS